MILFLPFTSVRWPSDLTTFYSNPHLISTEFNPNDSPVVAESGRVGEEFVGSAQQEAAFRGRVCKSEESFQALKRKLGTCLLISLHKTSTVPCSRPPAPGKRVTWELAWPEPSPW